MVSRLGGLMLWRITTRTAVSSVGFVLVGMPPQVDGSDRADFFAESRGAAAAAA
jgi:hypothetical protein